MPKTNLKICNSDRRVSVIIPTLNEEEGIKKVLLNLPREIIGEVIVVDSSADKTSEIVERMGFKLIHEKRRGYGRAVQTGIENSKGNIILYLDGDYTYDPVEILKLVQSIGKYDVVLGSRLKGYCPRRSMSFFKKFGNLSLSLIFDILFLQKTSDTLSGFRAIKKESLKDIQYNDFGMPYIMEQLIKLRKRGAKIGEVPIRYMPRIGKTKLRPWTVGLKILKTILRERFQSD